MRMEPIDFAGFARVCGGTGMTIEDPEQCGLVISIRLSKRPDRY